MPPTLSRMRPARCGPPLRADPDDALMTRLRGRWVGPLDPAAQWQWARDLSKARRVIPLSYQGAPGDLLALMSHAVALDVPLPLAWQHLFFNDEGRGGMSGILMHGLLIRDGHRVVPLRADEREVRMQLLRADGQPSGQARWTISEAARAGLLERRNWIFYPADMLWWRCMARLCRRWAPDVVHGLGYVPDELEGGVVPDAADQTPADTADQYDADGNLTPEPRVVEFLSGIGEKPWREVRAMLKKGHDAGLLGLYAGVVRGVMVTVEDVIVNRADAAQREEAQRRSTEAAPDPNTLPEPPAAPAAERVPDVPVEVAIADEARAWCGCPTSVIIETGNHDPGPRRTDATACAFYKPPFTPAEEGNA